MTDHIPLMPPKVFWDILEASNSEDNEESLGVLHRFLVGLPLDEIVGFHRRLWDCTWQIHTPDLRRRFASYWAPAHTLSSWRFAVGSCRGEEWPSRRLAIIRTVSLISFPVDRSCWTNSFALHGLPGKNAPQQPGTILPRSVGRLNGLLIVTLSRRHGTSLTQTNSSSGSLA